MQQIMDDGLNTRDSVIWPKYQRQWIMAKIPQIEDDGVNVTDSG